MLISALHFNKYQPRAASSYLAILECQAPTEKNCMAKCVFTEKCVGYIHGAKDKMSCELVSEAKIVNSPNNTIVKADVAKLNESKQKNLFKTAEL